MEKRRGIVIVGAGPKSGELAAQLRQLEAEGHVIIAPEAFKESEPSFRHCVTDEALAPPSEPIARQPLKLTARKDLKYYPQKGSKYHK